MKDIDFSLHQILVREGKGAKDRVTMLPVSLVPALQETATVDLVRRVLGEVERR